MGWNLTNFNVCPPRMAVKVRMQVKQGVHDHRWVVSVTANTQHFENDIISVDAPSHSPTHSQRTKDAVHRPIRRLLHRFCRLSQASKHLRRSRGKTSTFELGRKGRMKGIDHKENIGKYFIPSIASPKIMKILLWTIVGMGGGKGIYSWTLFLSDTQI